MILNHNVEGQKPPRREVSSELLFLRRLVEHRNHRYADSLLFLSRFPLASDMTDVGWRQAAGNQDTVRRP